MFAFIIPILNAVMGGLIRPFVAAWTNYERTKLTTREAGAGAAMKSDAAVMASVLGADVQLAAMKVQIYGTPTYRIITLIAGLPPAIHFGLIYIDTIIASKAFLGAPFFGVPKLPPPYDTFEWAIVSSFFLVHALGGGASNLKQWLASSK